MNEVLLDQMYAIVQANGSALENVKQAIQDLERDKAALKALWDISEALLQGKLVAGALVMSLYFKPSARRQEEIVLVVKGLMEGEKVVSFVTGSEIGTIAKVLGGQIARNSIDWQPDQY